jgi:NADH-quinone oxidoreductase subunit H
MASYYHEHPLLALANIPGLVVALVAAQGKLERTPFDIPDAECEIVGGTFTEYGGRFLAIFRMSISVEMVVVSALIAAVFFPFFIPSSPVLGFILFLAKTLFVVCLLSIMRVALARIRIEQAFKFFWTYPTLLSIISLILIWIEH